MVDYLPRSAWNARQPKAGPGDLTPSRVEGAVIHWPGTADKDGIHTQAEVASALRGWQNYHMDDRGWSDIAYQVAVDQAGRAWTLRGLRTQSGANGNSDLNEKYGAILLVLVAGEQPSAAMKATVRAVIADFRRIYGQDASAIKPHSAVRPDGTDCPGDAARAAIARGDFTPGNTTTPQPAPVQEDDDMTPEQERLLAEAHARGSRAWDYVQEGGAIENRLSVVEGRVTANTAARAQYAYDAVVEGGVVDQRLDALKTTLDQLDVIPPEATVESRLAAIEGVLGRLRDALTPLPEPEPETPTA